MVAISYTNQTIKVLKHLQNYFCSIIEPILNTKYLLGYLYKLEIYKNRNCLIDITNSDNLKKIRQSSKLHKKRRHSIR